MKPTLRFAAHTIHRITIVVLIILNAIPHLLGQTFHHPVSGDVFEYLGPGTYHYYDNGGANGNYSNNIPGSSISFIPDEGTYITWQLINYDIESNEAACGGFCCDVLTESWLPNCSNLGFTDTYCGTGQTFGPSFLCAGQSMTFHFTSNASITQAGWHVIIEVKQSNATNILCNVESNCFDTNVGGYLVCDAGPIPQEFHCSGPGACTGVIDYYPECNSNYYPGLERIYGFDLEEMSDILVYAECVMNVFVIDYDPCEVTACYEAEFVNGYYVVEGLAPGFYYLILELDCSNSGDICFADLVFECNPSSGGLNCDNAEPIECDVSVFSSNQEEDGATDANIDYCGFFSFNYTGRERIYEFVAPQTGYLVIGLGQLTDDLDLFILSSCDPVDCLGSSTNSASDAELIQEFVTEGETYFIVIDGYLNAESNYELVLFCPGTLDCGLTDQIGCGDAIESSNYESDGGVYGEDDYCGEASFGWNGRERIYEFFSTHDGLVTITLTGLNADLDLFVLASCDSEDCVQSSTNGSTTDEVIELDAENGQLYYIVIDGFLDASSFYTLGIEDCCVETIYQCYDIRPEFISLNNGFEYNLSFTTPGIPIIEWEIEGTTVSNSATNNLHYTFPAQGTYTVCAIYYDGAFGCFIKCCKEIVIDNPFDCGLVSYRYIQNQDGFKFTLEREANSVEEIIWTVDHPVELGLGNSLQSDLLSIGGNCREYVVSVRFFDKTSGSYKMCCIRLFLCSPTACSGTILTTVTNDFKTKFYTSIVYEEMEWYINDVLAGTGPSYEDLFATNSNLQVCLSYKDPVTDIYRVCCRDVVTSADVNAGLVKADIFPNPVSGELNISMELLKPGEITIELVNELGIAVKHLTSSSTNGTMYNKRMDLTDLAGGLYFLIIRTEEGVFMEKIVR